jgi:predicted membrane metal-binding protein
MAILIVASSLLFVAQNFVRLGRFLKLMNRILVPLIGIRMILQSELAVCLRNFVLGCTSGDHEDFIIIPFS